MRKILILILILFNGVVLADVPEVGDKLVENNLTVCKTVDVLSSKIETPITDYVQYLFVQGDLMYAHAIITVSRLCELQTGVFRILSVDDTVSYKGLTMTDLLVLWEGNEYWTLYVEPIKRVDDKIKCVDTITKRCA